MNRGGREVAKGLRSGVSPHFIRYGPVVGEIEYPRDGMLPCQLQPRCCVAATSYGVDLEKPERPIHHGALFFGH